MACSVCWFYIFFLSVINVALFCACLYRVLFGKAVVFTENCSVLPIQLYFTEQHEPILTFNGILTWSHSLNLNIMSKRHSILSHVSFWFNWARVPEPHNPHYYIALRFFQEFDKCCRWGKYFLRWFWSGLGAWQIHFSSQVSCTVITSVIQSRYDWHDGFLVNNGLRSWFPPQCMKWVGGVEWVMHC